MNSKIKAHRTVKVLLDFVSKAREGCNFCASLHKYIQRSESFNAL